MQRVFSGLETTGKALGWIGTITSALAALAALAIALNNRDIAQDNLRYQRINASLQLGTNLFRDLDNASERFGDECMAWVATFDSPSRAAWATAGSLGPDTLASPQAARCLAGLDGNAEDGVREQFVSRQIFNRLNTYFLPLQALGSGAFDHDIICDDVKGIVDTPATRAFFQTVARGTEIELDYKPVATFLASPSCGARRQSQAGKPT